MNELTPPYTTFEENQHLKPIFSKTVFDSLHGWDFGWEMLEPLNIAEDDEAEVQLAVRLSPGQKALYFFWYLDAQVTNGGFVQFYCNGYRKYLLPIMTGLRLIGDSELLVLLKQADEQYLANEHIFEAYWQSDSTSPPYKKLKHFEKLDDRYYKIHDGTMALIEAYARKHPEEFAEIQ